MRPANEMPQRRSRVAGRGRVVLIIVAILLFFLFTSVRQIAEFWTDYLWFDSVGFSQVWSQTLLVKVGLGVVFTAVFFVALWVNLLPGRSRLAPIPSDRAGRRAAQPLSRRGRPAGRRAAHRSSRSCSRSITGAGMSSEWNEWILFTNGGDFGTSDPQFEQRRRLLRLQAALPQRRSSTGPSPSLVIILLVTAVAHYLNGGIRLQSPFERVTLAGQGPPVRAAGPARAGQGGRLLAPALPDPLLRPGHGERRHLHRGQRAAAGALPPVVHRARRRSCCSW